MRLALSPARNRISLIRHRHRNSLLLFWVYWPQKVIAFGIAFVKNTVVGVIKEHFLTLLLLMATIIFAHTSLSGAVTGHLIPDVVNGTGSVIANIVEMVGAILFVILILLRSYDTTTGRTKKNRVTYSRKIDDDE